MQDSNNLQDELSIIEQYINFRDFLQKELSFHEYKNIHTHLGFEAPHKFTSLINGRTKWSFNDIVKLLSLLENPVLPSHLIVHFNLYHNLSEYELKAIDSAVTEG